jgi:sodium/proline symporter
MSLATLVAFALYFSAMMSVALLATHRQKSESDFLLGGRSLNFWVSAFMGLPVVVFQKGAFQYWTALGLILFMFLNWHFVAPKLRAQTEQYGALTLSSYFEKRLRDESGWIRIITAFISILFLTTYVAAGLIGLGYLFESLFEVEYFVGCLIGIGAIAVYSSLGGFTAIAWTDFFQGMFLLVVILVVPFLAISHMGGIQAIIERSRELQLSHSLLPDYSLKTFLEIGSLALGWGFGYFGQPHIIGKFMGIRDPKDAHKSKYVSAVWQSLALTASVIVGLCAIGFFVLPPHNPELIFVEMVHQLFNPFLAGLILCAILAATLSTMDSQILVLAAVISEDLYKKTFDKAASAKKVVWVTRIAIVAVSLVALAIAYVKPDTIFELVKYCWVGLGCAFGPLVIMSLHFKNITREGAMVGMLFGGAMGAFWESATGSTLSPMIPGFFGGLFVIWFVSRYFGSVQDFSNTRD